MFTLYPIEKTGFSQHGVEQKAPIQREYRGFFYAAFRLLLLMLAAGISISNDLVRKSETFHEKNGPP
ncbi:MAG: hypothetical protein JWQ09_263 [Segetibacter sp.]|nr:hypothetical protein [Segetibacter sp.]